MDLAFVLLADRSAPEPAKVIACGKKLGFAMTLTPSLVDSSVQSYDVDGGRTLMITTIEAPHPDARTMGFGPTAISPEEAKASPAHIIVTVLGLEGTPRHIDTQLAALTAAVVDSVEAIGAMLGHGAVFHKAKLFSGLAALGMKEGAIPAELAIDITTSRDTESRMSMLTHNLPRYGRENFYITCPINGKGALDFILGLARWVLRDPDKLLPTGETLGRSADEKLRIHRVKSPEGETVIRLDLPD
jgi:hypothetical protein